MVHAQYRSPFKNANIQCTALATHFGFRVGVEKNNLKVDYYMIILIFMLLPLASNRTDSYRWKRS